MSHVEEGPFGEWRAASAAVGNAITAGVTAAAAFVAFPTGSRRAYLEGRNFSTAVVLNVRANPWLRVLKTTDNLASNYTDYSEVAQNNMPVTGAVVLSSLSTAGSLWVGAALPFRGVFADVSANNTATNTAVATYWSATGPTMASLTISDGTAATNASLTVDGAITWTIPTDWTVGTLRAMGAASSIPYSSEELYWVKFSWNTALDSSTTLNQLLAMNRSTAGISVTTGRPGVTLKLPTGRGRWGCFEAVTDAGTGNLVVNVMTDGDGSRFV